MLSDEKIRELYATATLDTDWLGRYQRFVARIATMPDEELLLPERQRELWLARDVTEIGSGAIVDADQASQDRSLARELVALRKRTWPRDVQERAGAMQSEFDRLLAIVTQRHSKSGNQPWAQLRRVFAALLPGDLHCVVSEGGDEVHRRLVRNPSKKNFVADQVLSRARLREALGPEASLDEHVKRSVFCWSLYEHRATLGSDLRVGLGAGIEKAGLKGAVELRAGTPLVLMPFRSQRKGLTAIAGLSERYREVLRAASGGAVRDDLIETLRATNPNHSKNTCQQVISALAALGLLEYRDGRLYPSVYGKAFLEGDDPGALVAALLVHVFPFAHLLRKLVPGPKRAVELYGEFQEMYPQWTSTLAPSHAVSWAKHLGLVRQTSDGLELTEYGEAWEKRLPTELPSPSTGKSSFETFEENDEYVFFEKYRAWPDFATIWNAFRTDDAAKKFVLTEHQLASIHAAWHCNPQKRFVLLSGLSGTGKTQVASLYARLYCEHLKLDPKRHIALVPVSPDWRDPSGLLGYFSALHEEPTFHVEPALRLLIDAANDPGRPYFLILDEMNLARVERYFAPFLSAMETGDALTLHGGADEIDGVPPRIKWPTNLFIAGTVNMDETTYPFSDKVLDRAFTFEFWDVDLKAFFEKQEERDETVETVLLRLYEILLPVRRHFGYRTAGEVLAFVKAAPEGHGMALLDQAIFSKVLPRIRGENGDGLRNALTEAQSVCAHHGLERSAKKLGEMQKLLDQTGLTKFWA